MALMKTASWLALEWLLLLIATNLASFGAGLLVVATGYAPFEVIGSVNPGIGVAVAIGVLLTAISTARLVRRTAALYAAAEA